MRKLSLTLLILSVLHFAGHAQGDTVAMKAISAKLAQPPTEHIYLQLNKPRYERADTIWFKVYDVTNGHKLSAISNIAFAELISPNDTVVQHLNLKLESGTASGDFVLPLSMPPGTYHLRAYTNWMIAQGEGSFYNRDIVIGNPGKTRASSTSKAADVQFFPEGGELITGLRNVVAYKGVNADGSAANFKGVIAGPDGQSLAEFESNEDGMGIFALSPQTGVAYTAKITFANGGTKSVNLSNPVPSGYLLSVNNRDKDTVTVRVAANPELLKTMSGQPFYLVAQSDGKVCYTTSGKIDATAYRIKIPKHRFPSGVARFTLYAQNGEPVAERIAYIQNSDNLDIKLSGKDNATANQSIQINTTAQSDKAPTSGSFSAAVFNEDKVPFDETAAPNIFTTLLLSDEIRGKIANPAHYLADANSMDLLMLTQGYRKLEWKKTDAQPSVKAYQNEDGLKLSGTVTDNKGKPVIEGKMGLLSTNPIVKRDTVTDINGNFAFTGLDVENQVKFVLKAQNGKTNNVKIALDRPERPKMTDVMLNTITDTSASSKQLTTAIQNSYRAEEIAVKKQKDKELKEVTIKGYKDPQQVLEDNLGYNGSANLNGAGHADQILLGEDMATMGCPLLSDCLRSKLAMVSVINGQVIDISRGHNGTRGGGAATVLLDGARANVDDVNVNDVYSIEFLTSAKYKAIYGHDAAGGLLIITTKRGAGKPELIPVEREPGLIDFAFNGYYKTRTFYQPKYQQGDAVQPSAIYWKPDILTDETGKATLNFNNLGKGRYRVIVEGIDGDGLLGRAEYKYEVN